jgi:hypothetical protein
MSRVVSPVATSLVSKSASRCASWPGASTCGHLRAVPGRVSPRATPSARGALLRLGEQGNSELTRAVALLGCARSSRGCGSCSRSGRRYRGCGARWTWRCGTPEQTISPPGVEAQAPTAMFPVRSASHALAERLLPRLIKSRPDPRRSSRRAGGQEIHRMSLAGHASCRQRVPAP